MQDRPTARKAKKSGNLSIDAELGAKAKAAGTKPSAVLEAVLHADFKQKRWKKWRAENREAIDDYNRHVEDAGLLSDIWRKW